MYLIMYLLCDEYSFIITVADAIRIIQEGYTFTKISMKSLNYKKLKSRNFLKISFVIEDIKFMNFILSREFYPLVLILRMKTDI